MATSIDITFYGHACFGISRASGGAVVIDPFSPEGFNGAIALSAVPDTFSLAFSTHAHADHAALHAVPSARRVHAPYEEDGLRITSTLAAHDEYGGRLRGGMVELVRLTTAGVTILHCSDLGERPAGSLARWLTSEPVDVLIVPVGGYYTLGPDGAAEVAALVRPRYVIPCHSSDDGVKLAELGPREPFVRRFPSTIFVDTLRVTGTERITAEPRCVVVRPRCARAAEAP